MLRLVSTALLAAGLLAAAVLLGHRLASGGDGAPPTFAARLVAVVTGFSERFRVTTTKEAPPETSIPAVTPGPSAPLAPTPPAATGPAPAPAVAPAPLADLPPADLVPAPVADVPAQAPPSSNPRSAALPAEEPEDTRHAGTGYPRSVLPSWNAPEVAESPRASLDVEAIEEHMLRAEASRQERLRIEEDLSRISSP